VVILGSVYFFRLVYLLGSVASLSFYWAVGTNESLGDWENCLAEMTDGTALFYYHC